MALPLPDVDVTIVNRDNFFLFTPMLHEVAASDLDITNIVNPVRKLVSNMEFFDGDVEKVDLESRTVTVSHGDGHTHDLPYDHLVLAPGSVTNFFDLPGARGARDHDEVARRRDRAPQPDDPAARGSRDRVRRAGPRPPHDVRRRGRRIRRRRDDRRHERLRPPGAQVLPAHPEGEDPHDPRPPGRGHPAGALREARPLRPGEARRARRRDPFEDEGHRGHRAGREAVGRDRDRRGDDHLDGGHAAEPAR